VGSSEKKGLRELGQKKAGVGLHLSPLKDKIFHKREVCLAGKPFLLASPLGEPSRVFSSHLGDNLPAREGGYFRLSISRR